MDHPRPVSLAASIMSTGFTRTMVWGAKSRMCGGVARCASPATRSSLTSFHWTGCGVLRALAMSSPGVGSFSGQANCSASFPRPRTQRIFTGCHRKTPEPGLSKTWLWLTTTRPGACWLTTSSTWIRALCCRLSLRRQRVWRMGERPGQEPGRCRRQDLLLIASELA